MFDHAALVAFAAVAFAAVAFAAHLAVAWLARRRADPAADGRPDRLGDDRLRCPHCEAVNDPAYRFCRRCVETLQTEAPTVPTQAASGGWLFR